MITIDRNQNNILYIPSFQLDYFTNTGSTVLGRMSKRESAYERLFIINDITSGTTNKFYGFQFTESDSEVLSAATVSLQPGHYDFYIYDDTGYVPIVNGSVPTGATLYYHEQAIVEQVNTAQYITP